MPIQDKSRIDVRATPNNECPSCNNKTVHTEEHWEAYHPLRGHGFSKVSGGWSHPDLAREAGVDFYGVGEYRSYISSQSA